MAFDVSQFTKQIENLDSYGALQLIGTKVYLISFILLIFLPILAEIIIYAIFMKKGNIRVSTIFIAKLAVLMGSVFIALIIIAGYVPFYANRI